MQFISVLIIAFLIKRYVCIDIEELFGIGQPLFNNVNVVSKGVFPLLFKEFIVHTIAKIFSGK